MNNTATQSLLISCTNSPEATESKTITIPFVICLYAATPRDDAI